MILHQMSESGNCYKVRLAARQLGIPLDLKDYGQQTDGKTHTPEFLNRVNANAKVPVLELDDGRMLPESGAILFYLSEKSSLQPNDRWGRAEMLQWMFFEQYSHEPAIAVMRFLRRFATPAIVAARAAAVPDLIAKGYAALGVMERHLSSGRDWFAGQAYSIADIALFAYTHKAGEGGFDLGRFPAVNDWIARVQAQPDYQYFDGKLGCGSLA